MAAAAATNQTYGGAVPPPPGVTPNLINPERVTGGVVPVSAVFLTLSTIALGLRLYTKIGIIKIFGKEDSTLDERESIWTTVQLRLTILAVIVIAAWVGKALPFCNGNV